MVINTREILDFWFGDLRPDGWVADEGRFALWFGGKSPKDDEIRQRFGAMIDAAMVEDEVNHEKTNDEKTNPPEGIPPAPAESTLARIILLDQFTRMVHRGDGRAFAGDARALLLCHAGLQNGADKTLPPVQRQFFYLPLEHSESLDDQHLCVSMFSTLRDDNPDLAEPLTMALDYAVRHRDIIARFGRFPHRNKALARESTPDEASYLQTADTFGQG